MGEATADQLKELAEGLHIQRVDETGRKARQMRVLRAEVEKKMEEKATEEGVLYLESVLEAAAVVFGGAVKPNPKVEEDARRREALARAAQEMRTEGLATEEEPVSNGMEALLRNLAEPAATSLYRRQLKINGSIGGKDQLAYLSLAAQVTDAKKSGYTDHEVMVAVKRAIAPSSTLRSYIDSKPTLKLKEVLAFLRDFYAEKTAAEWFTQLANCVQRTDEKPIDFVLRALEARQRVIAASNAEEGQFEEKLVRATFCRAIRTGLQSGAIRNHMKPFLDPAAEVSDDNLLKQINIITAEKDEISAKQKETQKMPAKPAVGAIAAEDDRYIKLMKPLVDSVAELTKQMKDLQAKQQPRQRGWRQQRDGRCKECQKNNINKCEHCFKCGAQDGHFVRNCKQSGGN